MRTGDPRVLTCEDCGKQCKTISALTRHRRSKQHPSVASARPRGLTHVCPHCGRQFLTLAALLTHRTVKHREKKVPCTSCDLGFPSHALRRAHERESEHGTEAGVGEDLEGDMEGIIDNLKIKQEEGNADDDVGKQDDGVENGGENTVTEADNAAENAREEGSKQGD